MSEPATEPVTAPVPLINAPPGKPRRGQQIAILAFVGVLVLVVVGIGVALFINRAPAKMSVTGATQVSTDPDVISIMQSLPSTSVKVGADCSGAEDYNDLNQAQVSITDDAGHTLGLGSLGPPVFVSTESCLFPFTVDGIRKDKNVYTITVGHRGSVKFTLKQMENGPILVIQ